MNPSVRLERFEEKHGTWDELLDKYCNAKYARRYPDPEQEKLAKKYDRLMRKLDKLAWHGWLWDITQE